MSKALIEKAGNIINNNTFKNALEGSEPFCVLAQIDEKGYPTASTITPSQADGINWITFCTGLESNKAKRIEKCNRASVCFNKDGAYNITLVGTIKVITDPAVKQEMWYDGMEHHFSGYDDPSYCVLRFKTERYNLFVEYQEAAGEI